MANERTAIKRVKNGVLFSDGSIRIENARASYPHVDKPQKNKADDGTVTESFSINLLMPKDTHREIKDLCRAEIEKLLKEARIKAVAADRKFIKDGDGMAKDENVGMWVISAREKSPPSLRSNKKDPKTGKPKRLDSDKDRAMFYGGCYVSCLIRPWVQNNSFGKRVNANLLAVQFIGDGEPFGESRIKEDDVDDSFEADDDDAGGFDEDDDDDL